MHSGKTPGQRGASFLFFKGAHRCQTVKGARVEIGNVAAFCDFMRTRTLSRRKERRLLVVARSQIDGCQMIDVALI